MYYTNINQKKLGMAINIRKMQISETGQLSEIKQDIT